VLLSQNLVHGAMGVKLNNLYIFAGIYLARDICIDARYIIPHDRTDSFYIYNIGSHLKVSLDIKSDDEYADKTQKWRGKMTVAVRS
jgi:hypothetical protein